MYTYIHVHFLNLCWCTVWFIGSSAPTGGWVTGGGWESCFGFIFSIVAKYQADNLFMILNSCLCCPKSDSMKRDCCIVVDSRVLYNNGL